MPTIITNFLLPTHSNGYSPTIFGRKVMSFLLAILLVFNVFVGQVFPNFVNTVEAASYSAGEIVQLTNSDRVSGGLIPLNYSRTLEAAAYAKAQDMLNKDYWAHFGPNGETPWQFIIAQGYIYQYAGENLGRGFSNASSLQDAWMASPTHYANIMKSEFREIGIAIVDGVLQGEQTTLVVVFFGALPGAQNTSSSSISTPSSTQTSVLSSLVSSDTVSTSNQSTEVKSNSVNTKQVVRPIVNSSVSSIAKVEIPPNPPSIIEPVDKSSFNTNDIIFKGNADVDSVVQLFQNDVKVGESIVDVGGVWSYKNTAELVDGNYEYKANAVGKNTLISTFSNIVNVLVDKTGPSIVLEDITGDDNFQENHKFSLKYKVTNLQNDHLNIVIEKNGQEYSEYVFTPESSSLVLQVDLNEIANLNISIKDDLGNGKILQIGDTDLKSQIFAYLKGKLGDDTLSFVLDSSRLSTDVNRNNIFDLGSLQGTFESLNVKQKVNISFASGFILLSLFDFLVLYKKKISISRAKNLLHIPQFAAILALALLHGFGLIL